MFLRSNLWKISAFQRISYIIYRKFLYPGTSCYYAWLLLKHIHTQTALNQLWFRNWFLAVHVPNYVITTTTVLRSTFVKIVFASWILSPRTISMLIKSWFLYRIISIATTTDFKDGPLSFKIPKKILLAHPILSSIKTGSIAWLYCKKWTIS